MNDSIQIFAADHRQNVDWNLPYIRVGNFQSDAIIKVDGIDPVDQLAMSEGAQALYVSKHLSEFGNPAYVGLCHYRRTFAKISKILLDVKKEYFDPMVCLTPLEQLFLFKKHNVDFFVFARVQSYSEKHKSCVKNIIDEFYLHCQKIELSMSKSDISLAFDIFIDCLPNNLKTEAKAAMANTTIHCCNIFTTTSQLFVEWCNSYEKAFKLLKPQFENNTNKRWFGYLLERFTSIWIDANVKIGKTKQVLPLYTIDGKVHLSK